MAMTGMSECSFSILVIVFQIIITCFCFCCTGFHFKLTLLTLQTLLAGIVSQGLVDCEIRLADSDSHLPNRQEDFFQGQKKVFH